MLRGGRILNSKLCEMARLAFFSTSPHSLFDLFDCETEVETPRLLREKIDTARRTEPPKQYCETRELCFHSLKLDVVLPCESKIAVNEFSVRF